MNKSDLVAAIAAATGLTKRDAAEALTATFDVISTSLATGEKVAIPGFGAFMTADRAERIGKNPQTGETMTIPAAKVVRFKPGQPLKRSLN